MVSQICSHTSMYYSIPNKLKLLLIFRLIFFLQGIFGVLQVCRGGNIRLDYNYHVYISNSFPLMHVNELLPPPKRLWGVCLFVCLFVCLSVHDQHDSNVHSGTRKKLLDFISDFTHRLNSDICFVPSFQY